MQYYNINTSKILSKSEVKKAVYPSSLPKNFTLENIIDFGIKELIEIERPAPSTNLKTIIASDPAQNEDGDWQQVWSEVDKFSDISDGLTKAEQEAQHTTDLVTQALANKINELKNQRKKIEFGGIVINGISIDTSREGRSALMELRNTFEIDSNIVIDFKSKSGWTSINKSTFDIIAVQVINHVQKCFSHEKFLNDSLQTNINTDITMGWTD